MTLRSDHVTKFKAFHTVSTPTLTTPSLLPSSLVFLGRLGSLLLILGNLLRNEVAHLAWSRLVDLLPLVLACSKTVILRKLLISGCLSLTFLVCKPCSGRVLKPLLLLPCEFNVLTVLLKQWFWEHIVIFVLVILRTLLLGLLFVAVKGDNIAWVNRFSLNFSNNVLVFNFFIGLGFGLNTSFWGSLS